LGRVFFQSFVGDAVAQQNIAFNDASLSGSFAFFIAARLRPVNSHCRGASPPTPPAKSQTSSPTKTTSGSITLLPNGTVYRSYAVDAISSARIVNVDGPSRDLLVHFYLISPTQAVFRKPIQYCHDGTFSAQTTTPISAAALAGDYAFSWSGVGTDGRGFCRSIQPHSSVTLPANRLQRIGTGKQFFDFPQRQFSPSVVTVRQANTAIFNLQTTPADTFQFTAYVVIRTPCSSSAWIATESSSDDDPPP